MKKKLTEQEKKSRLEELEYFKETKETYDLSTVKKEQEGCKSHRDTSEKFNEALRIIRLNKSDLLTDLLPLFLKWEKNLLEQELWGEFLNLPPINPQSFMHYAIMHNAIDYIKVFIEVGKKTITMDDLMIAIRNHSESAFKYLLNQIPPKDINKNKLIDKACELGNVSILKLLNVNYFTRMIGKKENINHVIFLAYRNSSMQDADDALKAFIEDFKIKNKEQSGNLLEEIKIARSHFLNGGTQIARYRKECDLIEISTNYTKSTDTAAKTYLDVGKEIKFGLNNFSVIEKILEEKIELKLTDEFQKELPLPGDLKDNTEKFYSMRALLSIFTEAHYQEVLSRTNNEELANKFKTLRKGQLETPCSGRYECALPFIKAMANLPDADTRHIASSTYVGRPGYVLKYKTIKMNEVTTQEGHIKWSHGQPPVKALWPEIEKLHAQVFSLSPEQIYKDPLGFYNRVVEVIWLMGNLTPTDRGTGRYVEQWLALVHKHHKLPMPILKPGLQLDCLDITFSLPVYQKLFLSFCEPSSLALPVVEAYRHQCKKDPETVRLLEHFEIKMDPDPTDNIVFFQQFHNSYDLNAHIAQTIIRYKNDNNNSFGKSHGISRANKLLMDNKDIINFLKTGRVKGENHNSTLFRSSGVNNNSLRLRIAKTIQANASFLEFPDPNLLSAAKDVIQKNLQMHPLVLNQDIKWV